MKIPDLHDGFLTGLSIISESGKKNLEILTLDVNQKKYKLVIKDLIHLRADNFLQGNIICDIHMYVGESCPSQLVCKHYDYTDQDTTVYMPDKLNEIHSNNWFLIELISSYGCELLGLFKSSINDIVVCG